MVGGPTSRVNEMLVITMVVPFLLFSWNRERKLMIGFAAISFTIWLASLLTGHKLFPLREVPEEIAQNYIAWISDFTTFSALAIVVYFFTRSVADYEEQLTEALIEARTASRAKTEFLSSMSHETRTPLNAILGFSQLMELDNTLKAEHRDMVSEISRAGDHLLGLINQILDLSRIESGKLTLSPENIALPPLIEECLTLVSTAAGNREIELKAGQILDLKVYADRLRLKQALLNLLSNAVKYNHEGGHVMVSTETDIGNSKIQIIVSDTGRGIPSEQLDAIFQPFNRIGAENSNIEGAGIGLTISRQFIELMGGDIRVTSSINNGSETVNNIV